LCIRCWQIKSYLKWSIIQGEVNEALFPFRYLASAKDKGKEYGIYRVSSVNIKHDLIQILNTIGIINTEILTQKSCFNFMSNTNRNKIHAYFLGCGYSNVRTHAVGSWSNSICWLKREKGEVCVFVRKYDDVIAKANTRLDPTATTTELWRN
jgi:hypothetical protein